MSGMELTVRICLRYDCHQRVPSPGFQSQHNEPSATLTDLTKRSHDPPQSGADGGLNKDACVRIRQCFSQIFIDSNLITSTGSLEICAVV